MKNVNRTLSILFILVLFLSPVFGIAAAHAEDKSMLIHIKTGLKQDDAQICVAYNVIWAALEKGMNVSVLIDADAVNTYKKGWFGKDDLEGYKIPQNLRNVLAGEFGVSLNMVPETYGAYLAFLHKKGAAFYINGEMLVVAGISKSFGDLENISTPFFKPVTLKEMVKLRTDADSYMVY